MVNSAYSSQQTTLPQIVDNDDDDTDHTGLEEDEVSVLFINIYLLAVHFLYLTIFKIEHFLKPKPGGAKQGTFNNLNLNGILQG